MTAVMNSGGVMLTGWLRKSPPERKLRKNAWKKRWFVLRSGRLSGDPNVLEYFRREGSKKPIRAISLDECSQIDANVPIKYEKKDPSQQYVFDIVTKTRTYYLVAESSLEMASWVRFLCDLCGFNHDSPENQQDLGSQQQTFKAVQPISGRTFGQNGSVPLLEADTGNAHQGETPVPLPRPQNTITEQSVPIQSKPIDANGNIREDGHLIAQSSASASSTGSGHVSEAVTPENPRRLAHAEKNGYSFAVDTSQNNAEYLLLTDCTAAVADLPANDYHKYSERRTSSDSVFTHDGENSDASSDVMLDAPPPSAARRLVARVKTQRLDSMPDIPPPLPPTIANHHSLLNTIDDRGYSYPPDHDDDEDADDDVVFEAATRPILAGRNLPPIDDSDLNRVPPSLQKEYKVDEMGNPLPGSSRASSSSNASSRFAGLSRNLSAGNSSATEYINTADASAEVGIGYYPGVQRRDSAHQRNAQQFPIPGRPFASPNNRIGSPQFSPSPSFFNSPPPNDSMYSVPRTQQLYDVPAHQVLSQYASPKHTYPYNSKSSLYSSSTTLSPPSRNSPQRMQHAQFLASSGLPRIRRSSSVGRLETVANELAAQSSANVTPTHMRRRSIDHRRQPIVCNPSTNLSGINDIGLYSVPGQFVRVGADRSGAKSNAPPPRPPKSQATVKQVINSQYSPLLTRQFSSGQVGGAQQAKIASSAPAEDRPISPVHTAVICSTIPDSPPHTTVTSFIGEMPDERSPISPTSPDHTTVVTSTVDAEPGSPTKGKQINSSPASAKTRPSQAEESSRSISCSSAGSGGQTETTPSRSPVSLYDVPAARHHTATAGNKLMEVNDPVNLYDVPKSKITSDVSANSRRLAEIEDVNHPSYEPMMSQSDMVFERIDDTSHYTSMAGASTLINHSPFSTMSKSPSPLVRPMVASEPPPIKRDLKPGRRSLGSDGGSSECRSHPSRGSCEESLVVDFGSPNSYSHSSEGPVSPPHATLMHSMPASPQVMNRTFPEQQSLRTHGDRLYPPERPPKHPSQSSLSPRTPPSASFAVHVTQRTHGMSYTVDRTHKVPYDNTGQCSPGMAHPASRHKPGLVAVPGRPPKPFAMTMQPTAGRDDGSYPPRSGSAPARPPKSGTVFTSDFVDPHFQSGAVPPAPSGQHEKELNYVQLTTSFGNTAGEGSSRSDAMSSNADRPPKAEEGVQYIVIDSTKTTALQIMKKAREEELSQHKRPVDTKSGKGSK